MNVLVSGVGGDIGFGIARILRKWGIFSRLYGIDIHSDHPGSSILDECDVAPKASDAGYISWLSAYIAKNKIEIFIPSSEAEINVLAEAELSTLEGARVLRNNRFTVQHSLDKHVCLSYLASKGIAVPDNGIVEESTPLRYPVVVKPRSGQGSKGVAVIKSAGELRMCQGEWVWQNYLTPENEEYTCAVYASPVTSMRTLIIKRKLIGGLTGSGVIVRNPEIEEYVGAIANVMQLNGAINIQLRLTEDGPLLFEINPRLSSTLVFRDKIGFTDLRWWVFDKLGLDKPTYTPPSAGTRFYRGAHEYIFNA
ncbi:ATP-grasp domain-containing protein [Pusillimonas sp.]|uniref:ATP-grasp domain-containing protein n=1 Tax=Pusillimonas sp. TaxID=3040095 RepID=UPI0029A199FF|nr:ATP-grasp domain-containing protein [Pusillimonas sp.]MDX3895330.1 ATP-grasp domain-containing protein [Pusillimonas sp.]